MLFPLPQQQLYIKEQISFKIISFMALLATLIYIFLIPWGNYVFDGFTKVFAILSLALSVVIVVVNGTHRNFSFYHLFIVLFVAWSVLSVLWSYESYTAVDSVTTITQMMFISFVVTLIIDSAEKLKMAYQAYVLGVLCGSLVIFYNYVNGIESIYWARYSIQNFEPDGVGIIIAYGVVIAAYLTTQYNNLLFRLFNTALLPIFMFAIFLNATRTASIVAVFGLVYWVWTYRKAKLSIKVGLVLLFISSIIVVFSFAPKESVERLSSSSKSASSGTLNGRTVIWGAALEQWKKSPVIGTGVGSFLYIASAKHVEYPSAHNNYIHILTEEGLIGLLIYLLIIGSIVFYIFWVPNNDKVYLLTFLFVISASQITMTMIYDKELWFALTIIAIHAKQSFNNT